MCLIVVGWQVDERYSLIVAANRDEYHARASAPAARWSEAPEVIGGRDLEAGGTWMAASTSGRFAAVTNVREPGMAPGSRSRGELPRDFLLGELSAAEFAATIDYPAYAGFNLLLSDGEALLYCSNRSEQPQTLPPGIYGLSNHRLDTPWPKLELARRRFAAALPALPAAEPFFDLLADRTIAEDAILPKTGVALEWERLLSAVFVVSENYGTRASSLLLMRSDGKLSLQERSFGPDGQALQSSVISTAV